MSTRKIPGKSAQKGFTLMEIYIVLVIMVIFTGVTTSLVFLSLRKMSTGLSQQVAQDTAHTAIDLIADEITGAGSNGLDHIIDGSNSSFIRFRKYKTNYDGYNPASDDDNDDVLCFSFVPPSGGDPFSDSYQKGFIRAGRGSGEDTNCSNWYRLTDTETDIREFSISYCRPDEDFVGDFDCTVQSIDNDGLDLYLAEDAGGDLDNTAACVWMIELYVKYARDYFQRSDTGDPSYADAAVSEYYTVANIRNAYTMGQRMNKNENKFIDCCDQEYSDKSITWCPSP